MKKILFNNDSVIFQTCTFLFFILGIVIILALLNIAFYFSNKGMIHEAERVGIPNAVLVVYMIDEIDDINSNALEYILGKPEEEQEFENNKREFIEYLNSINESNRFEYSNIKKIEDQFNKYTLGLRSGVFDIYKPEDEYWARARVSALENYAADNLQGILSELKNSNKNDIYSIKYNLELVDEAGDIIRDLQVYVGGDPLGKDDFFSDTQDFEKFLALLKPLERSAFGKSKLIEIDAYYKVIRDGGLEVFSGYNPSNKLQAIENIELLEHQILNELKRMLDYIDIQVNNETYSFLNTLKLKNNIVITLSLILLTIFITVSVFFLKSFNNDIFKPIKNINNLINNLSKGDINTDFGKSMYKGEINDLLMTCKILKEQITEREIYENELKIEKEKAELLSESKSTFLFNTIHEIQKSVNSILDNIESLNNRVKDIKGKSNLESISSSGKMLIEFIDNVLDFAKFESNRFKLESCEMDLRSLSEEVVTLFLTQAARKGIELRLEITSSVPDVLILDRNRLKKVMVNIIDNAVKFTEGGYISIKINSIPGSIEDQQEIIITIQDSGIGISKDLQNKVFNAFMQNKKDTSLSLAISNKIVSMMGGYFTLHSQEGVGTTFNLHIPDVKIASLSFKDNSIFIDEERNFTGSNIIVAVDEDRDAKLIKGYLDSFKLNLMFVSSGQEVIDVSRLNPPDLVLIDISMCSLSGFDAIEVMSDDNILKNIPKIVILSQEFHFDRKEILTECDGFIKKPVIKKELLEELYKLLPINKELSNLLMPDDFKKIDSNEIINWSRNLEHLQLTKNFNELISISNIIIKEAEDHGVRRLVIWAKKVNEASKNHEVDIIKKLVGLFLDIIREIL